MKFEIDFKITPGDGRGFAQAPPYEVEVDGLDDPGVADVLDEFVSDHGAVYGPGSVLTITRTE
jgi:hypothetical protein